MYKSLVSKSIHFLYNIRKQSQVATDKTGDENFWLLNPERFKNLFAHDFLLTEIFTVNKE